jgi:hypothetical protein
MNSAVHIRHTRPTYCSSQGGLARCGQSGPRGGTRAPFCHRPRQPHAGFSPVPPGADDDGAISSQHQSLSACSRAGLDPRSLPSQWGDGPVSVGRRGTRSVEAAQPLRQGRAGARELLHAPGNLCPRVIAWARPQCIQRDPSLCHGEVLAPLPSEDRSCSTVRPQYVCRRRTRAVLFAHRPPSHRQRRGAAARPQHASRGGAPRPRETRLLRVALRFHTHPTAAGEGSMLRPQPMPRRGPEGRGRRVPDPAAAGEGGGAARAARPEHERGRMREATARDGRDACHSASALPRNRCSKVAPGGRRTRLPHHSGTRMSHAPSHSGPVPARPGLARGAAAFSCFGEVSGRLSRPEEVRLRREVADTWARAGAYFPWTVDIIR